MTRDIPQLAQRRAHHNIGPERQQCAAGASVSEIIAAVGALDIVDDAADEEPSRWQRLYGPGSAARAAAPSLELVKTGLALPRDTPTREEFAAPRTSECCESALRNQGQGLTSGDELSMAVHRELRDMLRRAGCERPEPAPADEVADVMAQLRAFADANIATTVTRGH